MSEEEARKAILEQISGHVKEILSLCGEDVDREGLLDTPSRVAKMYYNELFSGIEEDPKSLINKAIFKDDEATGMIIVGDIPFYTVCEHHLVPFYGTASVGFIPEGNRIVGLSKIARVVDSLARRPQVQERMTNLIAEALYESELAPEGVGVVITAEHLCMGMRGIKKPGSVTTTSEVRGSFKDEPETRNEWLSLLDQQSRMRR